MNTIGDFININDYGIFYFVLLTFSSIYLFLITLKAKYIYAIFAVTAALVIFPLVNSGFNKNVASVSNPSDVHHKKAAATWRVMKCQQMSSYELEQNYYSCKRATDYLRANQY